MEGDCFISHESKLHMDLIFHIFLYVDHVLNRKDPLYF